MFYMLLMQLVWIEMFVLNGYVCDVKNKQTTELMKAVPSFIHTDNY